jgi:hypothetical protein
MADVFSESVGPSSRSTLAVGGGSFRMRFWGFGWRAKDRWLSRTNFQPKNTNEKYSVKKLGYVTSIASGVYLGKRLHKIFLFLQTFHSFVSFRFYVFHQ